MSVFYKIRHKTTGLYALAGSYNYGAWSKNGKVWTSLANLNSHLDMAIGGRRPSRDYSDAEVVMFETREAEVRDVLEHYSRREEVVLQKKEDERERKERAEQREERALAARLLAKYPDMIGGKNQ